MYKNALGFIIKAWYTQSNTVLHQTKSFLLVNDARFVSCFHMEVNKSTVPENVTVTHFLKWTRKLYKCTNLALHAKNFATDLFGHHMNWNV